jgi:hypothetical protein
MNIPYFLFIITLLVFPFLGLILAKKIPLAAFPKASKALALLLPIHNTLFFLGFSLKGDYIDYFIFSAEYLIICFAVSALFKSASIYAQIFRTIGLIGVCLGFVGGLFGTFLFAVLSQDFESDKQFTFESNGITYETRRYSFDFPTAGDRRYTFETYRDYEYLPVERKLDTTNFSSMDTELAISEDELQIIISKAGSRENLVFKSSNGQSFSKLLNKL